MWYVLFDEVDIPDVIGVRQEKAPVFLEMPGKGKRVVWLESDFVKWHTRLIGVNTVLMPLLY